MISRCEWGNESEGCSSILKAAGCWVGGRFWHELKLGSLDEWDLEAVVSRDLVVSFRWEEEETKQPTGLI